MDVNLIGEERDRELENKKTNVEQINEKKTARFELRKNDKYYRRV